MSEATASPNPPPAFTPGVVIGVIVAALAALCAVAALTTFHADLGGGDDNGGANALSRSAVGYAGLVSLLRARGDEVVISRSEQPSVRQGVLILTPPPNTDSKDYEPLAFPGPRLALAPKWRAGRSLDRAGWVSKAGLLCGGVARCTISQKAAVRTISGVARHRLTGQAGTPLEGMVLNTAPIESWQFFRPSPILDPLLTDENGGVIIARITDQPNLYAVSDPDLFNTQGLKSLDAARTATALIDAFNPDGGAIVFDVTLNGFSRDNRSLARALMTPPLLPATLCLLLAGLIMGAHALGRFGPAKAAGRVYALGKRALADNTAALVMVARREHRAGAGYAQLTRDAVLEAVGAPRDMSAQAADEFLDRLGATRGVGEPWTALKAQADRAADSEDLGRIARKLHSWKLEMTREHR